MNNSANLKLNPEESNSRLSVAHSVLAKALAPRPKYILEGHDFDPMSENKVVNICYYAKGTDTFKEDPFRLADILEFVETEYPKDEYDQRSNLEYLADNQSEVLTDFLNSI